MDWTDYSTAIINDTLTYYYFSLNPVSFNPKKNSTERAVQEVNVKKFLVIGNSPNKTFYRLATYNFAGKNNKKNAVNAVGKNYSLEKFSGSVTYENLDLKTNNAIYYSNGARITDPNMEINISKGGSSKSDVKTNYVIPECYMEYNCSYWTICNMVDLTISATKSKDFCTEPNFVPYGCRDFMGWFQGASSTTLICHDVVYPDPPIFGSPDPQQPPSDPNKKPCPGNPITTTNIARSAPGNLNGGRFGYTRVQLDGTSRFHGGIDVYAQPNTALYPVMDGVVTRIVNNVAEGDYVSSRSFGNLIEVESVLPNGQKVRTLYGHLNKVTNTLQVGSSVTTGNSMGLTGRTGNAARGFSPHVHIQSKINGTLVNPEEYLRTKFSLNGTPTIKPC